MVCPKDVDKSVQACHFWLLHRYQMHQCPCCKCSLATHSLLTSLLVLAVLHLKSRLRHKLMRTWTSRPSVSLSLSTCLDAFVPDWKSCRSFWSSSWGKDHLISRGTLCSHLVICKGHSPLPILWWSLQQHLSTSFSGINERTLSFGELNVWDADVVFEETYNR